jgi:hypothetical protein
MGLPLDKVRKVLKIAKEPISLRATRAFRFCRPAARHFARAPARAIEWIRRVPAGSAEATTPLTPGVSPEGEAPLSP